MTATDMLVTIAGADPSPTTPLPPTQPLGEAAASPTTTMLPPLSWRERARVARIIWTDRLVRSWPALALGALLALALVGVWLLREPVPAGARAQAVPLPTPPLSVPTASAPTAAPAGPTLPVALIAYAEPGGAALGALPSGQPYTVIAQAHGGSWLQLDAGSGPVWVEAASWGQAPIVRAAALTDLTPPTPVPPPPTAVPPAVIYVQAPAPAAQPAPQPTEAPGWHPPLASGYDPAAGAPDCPLMLSPERLEACLAGRP